jgi:hypothetical protein
MAVAFAALLAACGGLAVAATSSTPIIRACTNKRTGALRVARKCHRNERGLTWNVTGPVGLQGPRGFTGRTGAAGATGTPGATGGTGPKGAAGTSAPTTLASGQSESGEFGIRPDNGTTGQIDQSVTFPTPLAEGLGNQFRVTTTGTPVPECPGPGKAERGWLCIYSAEQANVSSAVVFDMEASPPTVGTGRFGFDIAWSVTAADAYDLGTYTITAP